MRSPLRILIVAGLAVFSSRCGGPPPPSSPSTAPLIQTTGIQPTHDEFLQVEYGMTQRQVESIFGLPGTERWSSRYWAYKDSASIEAAVQAGRKLQWLQWTSVENESMVVVFADGTVISKASIGDPASKAKPQAYMRVGPDKSMTRVPDGAATQPGDLPMIPLETPIQFEGVTNKVTGQP